MTRDFLNRFVAGRDEPRAYLRAPFSRDGWIYATNGHIAVRVPKVEGIDAPESDKPANIANLFEKSKRDNFTELPKLPAAEKCPVCNGSCIGYKCPECDGKGDFDKGSHNHSCKECGGSGQVDDGYDADKEPCVECDGDGESRYKAVKVGKWHYDRRYLAKIKKLPAVKFACPPYGEDNVPAYFVFDGGEGLLMPMRV